MALAQADPPQGSLGITTDCWLYQVVQSFQDPRLRLNRSLLTTAPPANPLAALHRPEPQVRQAAADGAARNPGHTRNRGYSATASGAGFACSEQAPVPLIEERRESIEADLDGTGVDHPAQVRR